jgi:two-component system, NtrC family, nitrogen regulation sensor histidine kinase NtrY
MRKYYSWNIALIVLCFLLAFGIESYLSKARNLTQYSADISNSLAQKEQESDSLFVEQSSFFRYFGGLDSSPICANVALETARALSSKQYTIVLYRGDSVLYTSNNLVLADSLSKLRSPLVHLHNGYYVQRTQVSSQDSGLVLSRLILVKRDYKVNSKYLNQDFADQAYIPASVFLINEVTPYPIRSNSGLAVAYIQSEGQALSQSLQIFLFLLYMLGFASMMLLGHKIAKGMQLTKRILPILTMILMFVCVHLIYYYLDFGTHFPDLVFLKESFKGPSIIRGSLAGILFNIFALLWFIYFVYGQKTPQNREGLPMYVKYMMSIIEHGLILICGFMAIDIHRHLIRYSTFDFDFDNVFEIDSYSMAAILCILLIWFIYSIFVYHTTTNIRSLNLPDRFRSVISPLIAIAAGYFALLYLDLGINSLQILISMYIFIVSFDFFIGKKDPILGWGITALLLYSIASATLLNTYKQQKDFEVIKGYVNALNVSKDSIAEMEVLKISKSFSKANIESNDAGLDLIKKTFNANPYLPDHYELTVRPTSTVTDSSLRNFTTTYNRISYIKDFNNTALGDSTWYRVEVSQRNESVSDVYHDDLFKTPMKEMQFMNNVNFAIYKDGLCINKSKNFEDVDLNYLPKIQRNSISDVYMDDKHYVIGDFDARKTIYVSLKSGGFKKSAYLVSHLFVLMVGISAFLWLGYSIISALLGLSEIKRVSSLRIRIQMAFIGLCLGSGVILACFSIYNSTQTVEKNYQEQVVSKAKSVELNVKNMFSYMAYPPMDSMVRLTKVINDISKIHNIDVDLYSTDGRLLIGSDKDIFRKGIVAPRMNANAYLNLKQADKKDYVNNENIGDLNYKTAYFKLQSLDGDAIAFAAMPLYTREQILQDNRADSIGILLTTYILLLIPALLLAYNISRRITYPIKKLGDTMAQVMDLNQPIAKIEDYESDDELGAFVQQFNNMADQIEENTKKLKQMAQLESWKDMARLVAHDIKNPLSPLKLSMQYLETVYKKGDMELFDRQFGKIAKSFLTQIDQIIMMVDDFTSINVTRKGSPNRLSIIEVLEHVSNTYQYADEKVVLDFDVPDFDAYIYADRSQITRIFDNLVKNGIQAVQGKEIGGRVTISTYGMDKNIVGIKISDNGKGISKDNYSKVFLPNFTTKTSGSGIGLAVCKNMVTAAKGNIRFESEEGVGTDFFVEFPMGYEMGV